MAKRRSAQSRQNRRFRQLLRKSLSNRHQHHPLYGTQRVRLMTPGRTLGKETELQKAMVTAGRSARTVALSFSRLTAAAISATRSARNLLAKVNFQVHRPPILNDPPEGQDPWTRVR